MLETLHDPTKGTWLRKKQRNLTMNDQKRNINIMGESTTVLLTRVIVFDDQFDADPHA